MEILVENFEELFGGTLSEQARRLVGDSDFNYRFLSAEERDDAISRYVAFLVGEKKQSGKGYHQVWEKGWEENLAEFRVSGSETALIPKFVRSNQPVRFREDLVLPRDSAFETNFVSVMRDYFFRSYLMDCESIVEFGCGTGTNLLQLARIFPDVKLIGSDWAASSVELIKEISGTYGLRLEGTLFDMFSPHTASDEKCSEADAAITVGAMEQLGEDYEPFLNYVLDSNIRRVIHFETTYELYWPERLLDFLAIEYIKKRNWLRGFFSAISSLESEGKIKILYQGKTFGSFFHDGYTVTVWEKASS